jgi:hypothetical protein
MIYIQSNSERTLAHHFDCSCALYGAIDSCLDYRLTSFEEVASGKFDMLIRKNLFVGSTEFMREIFKRAGLDDVRLPVNSNRDCEIITLAEAHKRVASGDKLFIKPIEIKLFTGLILDGMQYSCLKGLPDDTKVMAYEPFKERIESEWRVYFHNNRIIDSRNYSGDFMIGPDYSYVRNDIFDHVDFPCAYTIDVGIFASGENVVIEYNDMWAIGNYGMPNDIYLRALKDRYFEIINK